MTTLSAEVIVVGGGPAGAALSAELAGRGRSVLLADRATFPRPKACGECVNPGAVAALGRLGLLSGVYATSPVTLRGWELVTPGGRSAWAAFPGGARALGVDRRTFDAALLAEARRRGVRVIEGVRVRHVVAGSSDAAARASGDRHSGEKFVLEGDILVGADGLRSVVARGVGALRRRPRLRKSSLTWRIRGFGPTRDRGRLLLASGVTVGLAPVPGGPGRDDRWNATLVVEGKGSEGLRGRGWALLRDRLGRLTHDWVDEPRPEAGPWGSGPFDWPTSAVVVGRTLLVGDAAGYYDPLTGQGIFRALRGAELAAEAIDRALKRPRESSPTEPRRVTRPVDRTPLDGYSRSLARAFLPGRRVQGAVEGIVSHPTLREPALAILARWPAGGRLLAGVTGDVPAAGAGVGMNEDTRRLDADGG
jgi:flavin-dependent dehydrogenase